jgi:hypothetical protein
MSGTRTAVLPWTTSTTNESGLAHLGAAGPGERGRVLAVVGHRLLEEGDGVVQAVASRA